MKTFTILLLSLCWLGANATSWRVNSDPQVNAHFQSLQAAISSEQVLPGDTLYIENGSSFGPVSINKQLIIIGPGYFLSDNDSTYAYPLPATIQEVTFVAGSQGSRLIGVYVINTVNLSHQTANNITIERSFIGGSIFSSSSITGLTVRQCYLTGNISSSSINSSTIYNNIFVGGQINLQSSSGSHNIYNNVFYWHSTSLTHTIIVKNSSVANNIIIRQPASAKEYCINFSISTNSTFSRNIMTQSPNASFPDNMYGIEPDSIFVATGSPDAKWKLKEGSPAIGYAANGQDAGAFGGFMPYVLSGLPFLVPRIIEAVIPAGSSNDQIPVHLKIKMQEE